jgi:hypothetical protein
MPLEAVVDLHEDEPFDHARLPVVVMVFAA